jgi:hypothetical protein
MKMGIGIFEITLTPQGIENQVWQVQFCYISGVSV